MSVVELTGSVEAAPVLLAAIGAAIAAFDGIRHVTEMVDEREARPAWWFAVAVGVFLLLMGLVGAPAALFFPNDTIAGAADLLWLADALIIGVAGAGLVMMGARRARAPVGSWPIAVPGAGLALVAAAHAVWMATLPVVPVAPPLSRPVQIGWPMPVGPEKPAPAPWVAAPMVVTATQEDVFDLPVRLVLPGVVVVQSWWVRAGPERGRSEFPLAVGERWTWGTETGDLTLEVVGAAVAYGRRDFVLVYTAEGVQKRFLAHTNVDDVDGDVNFAMSADDYRGAGDVDECSLQYLDDRFENCMCIRHPERFGAAPGPVRCGGSWGYNGGGIGFSFRRGSAGVKFSGGSGMRRPDVWLKAYDPGGAMSAAPRAHAIGSDPAILRRIWMTVPEERDAIDVLAGVVPGLTLTTAQVEDAARFVEASLDSQAAVHGVLYPAVTDPERYHPGFQP